MFCRQCGQQLPDNSAACARCGAATGLAMASMPAPGAIGAVQPKNKQTYALLGILFGFFGFPGVHNLYIGNTGKGMAQILISALTCWILWLPMFIWAIVEVCTETKDAQGNPLV